MEDKYYVPVKTSEYLMMSCDFSQQEPKLTAFVSQDPNMIKAFKEGQDIYAFIASLAFHKPYEECLEFHPETGEYQPEGKARRSEAKVIVLGICYGRSIPSIGQQLYGSNDEMSDEDKTKEAQKVYDAVLKAFPNLHKLMVQSQAFAHKNGYVETILGRRRHLPDMMLDDFEFEPLPGYVNPNIDPLDPSSMNGEDGIPQDKINALKDEFSKYKYFGQIARRMRELYEKEHIKVINNRAKKNDARRQCVNCLSLDTEILTVDGWKKYNEVSEGDEILSYNLNTKQVEKDKILCVIVNEKETEVVHFKTRYFEAYATPEHRWVAENFDSRKQKVVTSEYFESKNRPRYHILRTSTYGNTTGLEDWTEDSASKIVDDLMSNSIAFNYLTNLSAKQLSKVYYYIEYKYAKKGCVFVKDSEVADMLQFLSMLAGFCNNCIYYPDKKKYRISWPFAHDNRTARIDMMHKDRETISGTWCVTTNNSTWIARYHGKCYITGNSIIQGSAADFTKTALIKVANDPRWKDVGGEILTVVHDEIVAQAPVDTFEEAANILREDMEGAGSFLPFPIKCDTTISYRWYGLEAPCPYTKPNNINSLSEDEYKWIQYHLIELGYDMPVFKNDDGSKPIGDAAHGVSGKPSDEFYSAINNYCTKYGVSREDFVDNIESRVTTGIA